MPTYEYECLSCGKNFDAFQSMSDAPLSDCPTCGQKLKRKINGGMGIIFKGSGFYKSDNRKGTSSEPSPKPACESCSVAPACEAKKEAV
ncbi:MAG: zinc ribbon domain-containing protein [Spirochaetaceae bacterium]|nr:zinc ribbon domain-containing protein [Spirochaetaceae bacterium]